MPYGKCYHWVSKTEDSILSGKLLSMQPQRKQCQGIIKIHFRVTLCEVQTCSTQYSQTTLWGYCPGETWEGLSPPSPDHHRWRCRYSCDTGGSFWERSCHLQQTKTWIINTISCILCVFQLQPPKVTWQKTKGRPTLQQRKITFAQTSEGLITRGKQGKVSLLFQHVSQASGFHEGQKDPAVQRRKQ